MSGNPLQLFLNRFLLVNKERYKDDAAALAVLNSLTLEEIIFENWEGTAIPGGPIQQKVDLEVVDKLVGVNQKYYTLDFASPLVSTPKDSVPVAEAELVNKAASGLYLYNDTTSQPSRLACAVVIRNPTNLFDEAVTIIKASCKFDLTDEDIVSIADGTVASVSTRTFFENIKLLVSEATEFLYDGTYKYDGSMTY